MKIYITSDHTGIELKDQIIEYLNKLKIETVDLNKESNASNLSYVDYGYNLGKKVSCDDESIGIGICGSGIGISIAANKVHGLIGARVCSIEDATLAKKHNNANALFFGARQESFEQVKKMIDAFLKENFEGDRHIERVEKLKKL
ncbi:MAG: RpiB/LacA/LacB family sugar-phosphate isomerase [Metamycoplasmataceae bacterium]